MMFSRCAGDSADQLAISSMVRRHPRQRCVAGSIAHRFLQGVSITGRLRRWWRDKAR